MNDLAAKPEMTLADLLQEESRAFLHFDYEWRAGSRDKAREIAREYVTLRRADLEPILGGKGIEELVALTQDYRTLGLYENRLVVDMWLLAEFEPQQISGELHVVLPIARAQ